MSNITLKGVLQYPSLNALDTKFDDKGLFKTNVVASLATHQKVIDKLQEVLEEFRNGEGKKQNKGKVPRIAPDGGLPFTIDEDEGTVTFKTKSKAYESKEDGKRWTPAIAFFMGGEPLGIVKITDDELVHGEAIPQIGGGTKAMVGVELRPWMTSGKCGISLRPRAVKIVDLVERTQGGNEDDFFGDEDDDFDAPELKQATTSESSNEFGEEDF